MIKRATSQADWVKTTLRIPPSLHAALLQSAEQSGRTLNAELLERIASAEDRSTLNKLVDQNNELRALMREMLDRIDLMK